MKSRGFITIATGDPWYYQIANNLLKSYKRNTLNPLPFAIITDSDNLSAKQFDDVIIWDNASKSYLDKIRLLSEIPYDETIFIDADCLVYSDLNFLFSVFADADDFSCFGNISSNPEETTGWFNRKNLPYDIQKKVEYTVNLHGGAYFMRKTEKLKDVFKSAECILANYSSYKFNGFISPADEPILALSMAINKCKPIPFSTYNMVCYWNTEVSLSDKAPRRKCNGEPISLLHWGTRYTQTPYYKYEIEKNEYIDRNCLQKMLFKLRFWCSIVKYKLYIIGINGIEKASKVNFLKKIWHLLKK